MVLCFVFMGCGRNVGLFGSCSWYRGNVVLPISRCREYGVWVVLKLSGGECLRLEIGRCIIFAILKPCGVKANHISQMKSRIVSYAENELNILLKTVKDPIIAPFKDEIVALCEKMSTSGAAAPFVASAVSQAVKKLMMQQPICDITGIDEEWMDVTEFNDGTTMYQNKRCSALFKEGDDAPYYIDAVVFKSSKRNCFTSNKGVPMPDGSRICSRQYIKKFPFKPKSFYIDVISRETKPGWWEHKIKNPNQLKAVFKYYNQYLPK